MSANHNYIIVDQKGTVLWLRAVSACTPQVVLDACELVRDRMDPGEPVFIAESIEDPVTGKEQTFRLASPYLEAKRAGSDAPARIVEVWHRDEFPGMSIADHLSKEPLPHIDQSEYTKVTELLMGGDDAVEAALGAAYSLTQNIDYAWRPGEGCRSSSVGDVFVVRQGDTRQAWRVMAMGYDLVADFSASKPESNAS